MKYFKIECRQEKDKWKVFYELDEQERKKSNLKPHPLGFYYCSEEKGSEKGFEELKNCLIKCHEQEIKRLEYSLKQLRELCLLPEPQKKENKVKF